MKNFSFEDQPDPFGILMACQEVQKAWIAEPERYLNSVSDFWQQWGDVTLQAIQRSLGNSPENELIEPHQFDERFQDPIWRNHISSDLIKEYYLLTTRWIEDRVYETPQIEDKTKRKAAFWIRQGLNAVAPTNFIHFNPKAQMLSWENSGQNLMNGMKFWLEDLQAKTVKMVDGKSFEVGKNLATTPGKVIFQNELIELIQYLPTTKEVYNIPIVFVPPWINKYYILDINPEKSLVKYLVDKGFSVFMISWKNPTKEMRETHFEDYLFSGALKAIEVAKEICGTNEVHTVGYCIGGTALATLMAWLSKNHEIKQNPIAHATLLCSLVDFESPGDIDVFIDENSIQAMENLTEKEGFLDSSYLEFTFRLLRSNSLIWNYFVRRYLYGEDAQPFDILYWNTDGTRLPKNMFSFYLRELYLNNKLKKANALKFKGVSIDLQAIQQPLYVVGTEQDHITPWGETFKICHLVNAKVRYALATSGHIVGVLTPPVNPPKRRFWVGDASKETDAVAWRDAQTKQSGSWWEDWLQWLSNHSGVFLKSPPTIGNEHYPVLRDAPGDYVKNR